MDQSAEKLKESSNVVQHETSGSSAQHGLLDGGPLGNDYATIAEQRGLDAEARIELRRRGQFFDGEESPSSEEHRTWLSVDSVPGYHIKAMLGRGGMGEVFLATQIQSQREVALKLLARPSSLTRRFEREMHLAGKLEHPHIVKTFDAGSFDQFSYLAMEHIKGCNLAQLVARKGPLSVPVVIEILRQSLNALIHIHGLGIVHRDIKPANFMLSEAGRVKMLDLGLAKQQLLSDREAAIQTVTQHLIGTAAYAAPEQGFNTKAVGPASDIYALGCMAFFLLVGKHPYDGGTAVETFVMHRDAPIPNLASCCDGIDSGLADSIRRMMAKQPQDRPTAVELLEQFAQYPEVSLAGIAIAAPPSQLFAESDFELTTALIVGDGQAAAAPASNRKQAYYVSAGALTLLVMIGVVFGPDFARPAVRKLSEALALDAHSAAADRIEAPAQIQVLHTLSQLQAELLDQQPDIKESLQQLPVSVQVSDSRLQSLIPWLAFSKGADNRTALIHWLPAFVPLQTIVHCMRDSTKPVVRAACIQMLGVYEPRGVEALSAFERQKAELYRELSQLYFTDPDAEVHSSLMWLAKRWGWDRKWEAFRPYLQHKTLPILGGWYHPPVAPPMVVLPGPHDAELGSYSTLKGHDANLAQDERPRTVHIPRTFAVSVVEVTKELMWRVSPDHWKSPQPADGQFPVNAIQWSDAALFCNELSRLEGLPATEFCYDIKVKGDRVEAREFPDTLERSGYRLPTDDEWEIACRAQTTTSRPHGDNSGWLLEYSWCMDATSGTQTLSPVALRKPNAFGFFDMLGNISEWTNDQVYIDRERRRRLRGGSVWTPHDGLRSAARYYIAERLLVASERTGFRVARTLRSETFELPDGLSLQVGMLDPTQIVRQSLEPTSEEKELRPDFAVDHYRYEHVTEKQPFTLGDWRVGQAPAKRFRLVNSSAAAIEITPGKLRDTSLTFETPPVQCLLPGETTEFALRCGADFIGDRVCELSLEIALQGQSPSIVKLQVPVCLKGSKLVLEDVNINAAGRLEVDLGKVPVGALIGREFQVLNAGNLQTTARVIDTQGACELTRNSLQTLVPGGRDWFHVNLRANEPGEIAGRVTVLSSEGSGETIEIDVYAHAVASEKFILPGVFRSGNWLFNHNGDGESFEQIVFGEPSGIPLTGDWDGDGHGDLAVCSQNGEGQWQWSLMLRGAEAPIEKRKSEFVWGEKNQRPFVADINGDGRADFGLVSQKITPHIDDQSEEVVAEFVFVFVFDTDGNRVQDTERVIRWESRTAVTLDQLAFLAGDIDGDRTDEIILTRMAEPDSTVARRWKVCFVDDRFHKATFGLNSQVPFIGDWNADGRCDFGTSAISGRSRVFHLNLDIDQHPEFDIRNWALAGDVPVTIAN